MGEGSGESWDLANRGLHLLASQACSAIMFEGQIILADRLSALSEENTVEQFEEGKRQECEANTSQRIVSSFPSPPRLCAGLLTERSAWVELRV